MDPLLICLIKKGDSIVSKIRYVQKWERNIGNGVEHEETLCDEVETVGKFIYHGDWVSAGGGCETAVAARTRCGWVTFRLR